MGIADLPRPVGYVLGGGGSLGAIQVGMLQALSEHDQARTLQHAKIHSFPSTGLATALVTMRAQPAFEAPLVAANVPVVYLHGPEPLRVSPLDFRQTAMLIETAYEAARSFLRDLDITGPGLYGSP
jgi:predicted acylesterase/phospholipase RssA